jgi:hypothetical protein
LPVRIVAALALAACGDDGSATATAGGTSGEGGSAEVPNGTTASTGSGASDGGAASGGAGQGATSAGGEGGGAVSSDAEIEAAIEAASEGLIYISESEAPFELVTGSIDPGGSITEALVRAELASYVDADPGADKPLSDLFGMERPWSDWTAAMHNCSDPNDPILVELCDKMRGLEGVLASKLTGLTTFYFGSVGAPGDVNGIGVSIFLVGRTPSGKLVGVRTLAIWT